MAAMMPRPAAGSCGVPRLVSDGDGPSRADVTVIGHGAALTMGGAIGRVMIGWMLNMYESTNDNVAVVTISLPLLRGGTALDRSQVTVDDQGWMTMLPHHSLAITRSSRTDIDDVRDCRLAAEFIAAQEREIREMHWLSATSARVHRYGDQVWCTPNGCGRVLRGVAWPPSLNGALRCPDEQPRRPVGWPWSRRGHEVAGCLDHGLTHVVTGA